MTTKPNCRKCGDTGLRQVATSLQQCDCAMGAHFAGEPLQPAARAAAKAVSDARVLVSEAELAELRRLVHESAAENDQLRGELEDAEDKYKRLREADELTMAGLRTAKRDLEELQKAHALECEARNRVEQELTAARAAAAETARTTKADATAPKVK